MWRDDADVLNPSQHSCDLHVNNRSSPRTGSTSPSRCRSIQIALHPACQIWQPHALNFILMEQANGRRI